MSGVRSGVNGTPTFFINGARYDGSHDLHSLLALEKVKPDAFLGGGPVLGWGRLYGGQVVAQALAMYARLAEVKPDRSLMGSQLS